MIHLQDRYTFEAEMSDGSIMTKGGDISEAVRVSMIPSPLSSLPRHDFVGLNFIKRFRRGFKRTIIGSKKKQCDGESTPIKQDEYVQTVITEYCRVYVRHSDGAALVTPPDYELYL